MAPTAMELLAWAAPMSILLGASWRLSATLKHIQHKVDKLESENHRLRASLESLERLLKLWLDARP